MIGAATTAVTSLLVVHFFRWDWAGRGHTPPPTVDSEMARSGSKRLADMADLLTLARLVGAVVVAVLIPSDRWAMVGLLVAMVWLSDVLDGRLARWSGIPTRLGRFDLSFDTLFGAGVIVGLLIAQILPLWVGLGSLLVFGGFFLAGNTAAAMLLQLTGFVPLLFELWQRQPPTWWAPLGVALLAGVVDWRRLVFTNVPAFIRGVTGRFDRC